MFVVPWGDLSYIGTTDTDDLTDPDLVRATAEDVIYLLRSANALFPEARLQPADVVSTWAGIRPMVACAEPKDPSAVSREHRILESESGIVSVIGGKLTTYRAVAEAAVNMVAARLHKIDGRRIASRAPTDKNPLPGGATQDLDVLMKDIAREGFSQETAEHLVRAYGTESAAVVNLAQSDPDLADAIVEGHPAIRAELVHAIRREMAITLSDLLIRRTHLFYEVLGHAVPEAPSVVDLAARELGWDAGRKASELAAYLQEIQDAMAFRDDLRV